METTINHLTFLREQLDNILLHYKGKKVESIEYFSLGMLERLNNSIVSLSILIPEYQKDNRIEYSVGIILRSLLLDVLINLNLYILLKEKKEKNESPQFIVDELTQFANIFLSDGIKHTMDYMETVHEEGVINKEELQEGYNSFVKKYSIFFDEYKYDGSKPKQVIKNDLSNKKLFKTIMSFPEFRALGNIYDTYNFFSKYDHFGILYFELIRQPKEEKDSRITRSVELFFFHVFILLIILLEINEKDKELEQIQHIIGDKMKTIIRPDK